LADGWRAYIPVRPQAEEDLTAALDAVRKHGLPLWDAMLWATVQRVGVSHLFSEDFQDGRQLGGVRFVNPFNPANDALIDRILPSP
jgi:predicted nucleic acid-binding protein